MRIEDLQDGQEYKIRLGRAGEESANWGEWGMRKLYVQRHKGKIVVIALKDECWAEYRPSDYSPYYNEFLCEDYYMQIEGIEE